MAATTEQKMYAAALRGGYSKYHLIPTGTERSLCGTVPTWDGWTYVGDIVDEMIRRFGREATLCQKCYRNR